jgi:hypothetical protein
MQKSAVSPPKRLNQSFLCTFSLQPNPDKPEELKAQSLLLGLAPQHS